MDHNPGSTKSKKKKKRSICAKSTEEGTNTTHAHTHTHTFRLRTHLPCKRPRVGHCQLALFQLFTPWDWFSHRPNMEETRTSVHPNGTALPHIHTHTDTRIHTSTLKCTLGAEALALCGHKVASTQVKEISTNTSMVTMETTDIGAFVCVSMCRAVWALALGISLSGPFTMTTERVQKSEWLWLIQWIIWKTDWERAWVRQWVEVGERGSF